MRDSNCQSDCLAWSRRSSHTAQPESVIVTKGDHDILYGIGYNYLFAESRDKNNTKKEKSIMIFKIRN